ncbi:hypothetical protein A6F68_02573 [Tsuneonella dongtanensis]|uniref:Uncharacterized protein n=1 Tax=Tsuneonella dongtanensis TaxID=692370 RepID=A0A1B2AFY8_9SPHN|nr:hypothetical protein A6F68_02573 [Tsuneonella dongtanensis]
MTAFLLVALFAIVAVASALTLADAFLRGRSALQQLRGDVGRAANTRRDGVAFVCTSVEPRMSALRGANCASPKAVRSAPRRPVPTGPQPLRAAA